MRISSFLGTSAVLLSFPFTAVSTPAPTKAESKPWNLYEITLWTANATTPGASYIDFLFEDVNKGLQIHTECYRAAIPGNRHVGINDPENYYPCADPRVSFLYNKGKIFITRRYKDASTGGSGIVTASGHNTATFVTKKQACGSLGVDDKLKVPITGLSG